MSKTAVIVLIVLAVVIILLAILIPVILILTEKWFVYPKYSYEFLDNGDMENMRAHLVKGNLSFDNDELQEIESKAMTALKNITEEGYFENIDYNSNDKSHYRPIDHLENILNMQKIYYLPNHEMYQDEKLGKSIISALEFWVVKDFYCDWNHWYNTIGMGLYMSDIMLFENEGLSASAKEYFVNKLKSMSVISEYRYINVKQREINSTGGNLTDVVGNSLKYALIVKDGSAIMWMSKLIENELRPYGKKSTFAHRLDNEGIKPDMSFWQHYEMLYMGGYGEVFCDGINNFIEITKGTQFQISDKCLNFYADFLLDGMQYAMRGKYRDISASGRGIARPDKLVGIYTDVVRGCKTLLTYQNIKRSNELAKLLDNRTAENDIGAGGHKYFFNSDYNVYNNNYMATVRHASKQTKNSEALNGENVLGHYLGAGATLFYNKGDEYYNIPPLWDWNKISGTTAVQGYLPIGGDSTYIRMGKSSTVGGVSTGLIGASCIYYKDNYVTGKKAWFMFEDGVVCLGADISSSKKGDLVTCLNQTLLRGNVEYSKGNQKNEEKILQDNGQFDWIYNNGISYLTKNKLYIKAETRIGDWKTINTRMESKTHTDDVLELGIVHGSKVNNVCYDYTVLMNTSAQQTQSYFQNPTLITLSNNANVQAVMNVKTGDVQIVFWKKGELELPNGEVVKSNKPSIVTISKANIYASTLDNNTKLQIEYKNKNYQYAFQKGDYLRETAVLTVK